MNLLDLVVKIGVDDKATSKVAAIGNSIKGGLGTAAKAGVAALGAALASAATGVVALGKAALESYSQYELMLARNEIYARHGRGFNDQEIRQYFQSKSWYQQRYTAEEFDSLPNSPLTSIEQQNIKTIYDVEHSK